MKKIFVSTFLFVLLFFSSFKPIRAEGEFIADSSVYYSIDQSGKVYVTHYITLENALTDKYATAYSMSISETNASEVQAFSNQKAIPVDVKNEADKFTITVNFEDPVVGKGAKREFSIRYLDPSIVTKSGSIWEVSVPRLTSTGNFRNYSVTISASQNLGQTAYISPKPDSTKTEDGNIVYTFNKDTLNKSSISAAFGKFQVFSFDLTYHLENPLNRLGYVEIALPPDTQFQKVTLSQVNPPPSSVRVDQDGNWLAKYILDARQRVDVRALGSVQLFPDPIAIVNPSSKTLEDSKKGTELWQINNPEIAELAAKLKTPKAIYDYVVSTLSYDFERVKPNTVRFGALKALQNPKNAICMEFTDLFVALSRAAGIPAREVNGYAYTENPQLHPLSLVADVLHSWAEYWDGDKKTWVPVDPTWGSTSKSDFFTKLDLKHFAFVIHGENSIQPYPAGSYKLGPNPQKDVFVSFGTLPQNQFANLETNIQKPQPSLFRPLQVNVEIKNTGNTSISNQKIEVYINDQSTKTYTVNYLPPYGIYSFTVETIGGEVSVKSDFETKSIKADGIMMIIPYLLAILLILGLILISWLLYRFRKTFLNPFQKIQGYISSVGKKVTQSISVRRKT